MATASETLQAPAAAPVRWRPDARGWALRVAAIVGLTLLVLWRISTVQPLWADHISLAAVYAIIGLSLNVILGYTGQVSLGHHAFVGLAAFVAAHHITERAGCAPENGCLQAPLGGFTVAVLLAVLSGILSAGLLGIVALRIKGLYLALITLTYGFVAVNSIFEIPGLTRGGAGMPAPRPAFVASDHRYMYFCIALLAVCLFIDWRFLRTKIGRAVLAVKNSEPVAASYAVNVTVYKLMAFMLSGAFAGLAGALFAYRRQIVVATDFSFQIALLWVLMVVVGGLGKRIGVVIGSMFFALFPFLIQLIDPITHFLEQTLKRDPEEFTLVIGPALALLTMIQFPGGIAEQIWPLTNWLSGNRFTMHPGGKPQKSHGTLLSRLRRKSGEAAPALVAPTSSPELLEPTAPATVTLPEIPADEGPLREERATTEMATVDADGSSEERG
jgi:branched-chain amino acid transport system permease protein